MESLELLHRTPLFAGATEDDLAELLQVARRRVHEKGELLFSEGEEANGFYLVAEGRVKIFKLSSEGKERILHIVPAGSTFAEAAIFGPGCFPACAAPLVRSTLLYFPKREFLALLHSRSQIAVNMIGGLARFLRQFATQIEELTFKDVPSRLAGYLLDLPGGRVRELPISKTLLASRLGTVSETLSRTLRKLSDEGLIAVEGKRIEILDEEGLAVLASTTRE
ncbi:MAG: transcriptional regulator [Desulfuromonas sp.]|nr:MAG: transcriptional regulator [Desulfuromonas sp.]